MNDEIHFLTPSTPLLIALASLIIHYEEYLESNHPIDKATIDSIRNQPNVSEWMKQMKEAGFLPLKRQI